jgi:hypothetical protein
MADRRSFLRGTSALLAHASLPRVLAAFLAGSTIVGASPPKPIFFNEADMQRLTLLVDMILPATDSPSASEARTHEFIDAALSACATSKQQSTFRAGLAALVADGFDKANASKRVALLQRRATQDVALPYDDSFFKILKDYTLTGYFHSEIGATRALAYERVPTGTAAITLEADRSCGRGTCSAIAIWTSKRTCARAWGSIGQFAMPTLRRGTSTWNVSSAPRSLPLIREALLEPCLRTGREALARG